VGATGRDSWSDLVRHHLGFAALKSDLVRQHLGTDSLLRRPLIR
jgi:hypothetical protein